MPNFLDALFALELSFLLAHEMDAVYHWEWKMLPWLKALGSDHAHAVFTLLHVPLYSALIFIFLSPYAQIGMAVVDIFLIGHAVLHLGFKNHPANRLHGGLSRFFIFGASALAATHLAGRYFSE